MNERNINLINMPQDSQDSIDLFVENLLKQANLANLPEDYKKEYVERVKEQINQRLGIIMLENLDDDGIAAFSELMSGEPTPDINAIQKLCQDRIPEFNQKIQAALAEFAQDFVTASTQK